MNREPSVSLAFIRVQLELMIDRNDGVKLTPERTIEHLRRLLKERDNDSPKLR